MKSLYRILTLLLLVIPMKLYASDSLDIKITELLSFSSEESLPHYLKSNKWGLLQDRDLQSITLISGYKNFVIKDNLSLQLGLETGFGLSEEPELKLTEIYGKINYKPLYLFIGKMKHTTGSIPQELSSGSMTVSPNASPIPKISAGLNDYTTIPFTYNFIQVKGNMAHGWFQGDRYIENVYLHEKSFFIRGNSKIGLYPYGGMVHEAIWGGKFTSGVNEGKNLSDNTLDNFIKIFLAKSGGDDAVIEGEQINKLGNHLGIKEYGIYGYYSKLDFQLYYQHFFEDGSGRDFANDYDGLWGVNIKPKQFKFVNNILFEFLTTAIQSGKYHDLDGEILGGQDSYYHHYIYRNGWTHINHVIGNSFFSTTGQDEDLRISNNRINAYQLGLKGIITEDMSYTLQGAFAKYYPAYSEVSQYNEIEHMYHLYGEAQYSGLYEGNLTMKLGLAYDFGSAYSNTFGIIFAAEYNL